MLIHLLLITSLMQWLKTAREMEHITLPKHMKQAVIVKSFSCLCELRNMTVVYGSLCNGVSKNLFQVTLLLLKPKQLFVYCANKQSCNFLQSSIHIFLFIYHPPKSCFTYIWTWTCMELKLIAIMNKLKRDIILAHSGNHEDSANTVPSYIILP